MPKNGNFIALSKHIHNVLSSITFWSDSVAFVPDTYKIQNKTEVEIKNALVLFPAETTPKMNRLLNDLLPLFQNFPRSYMTTDDGKIIPALRFYDESFVKFKKRHDSIQPLYNDLLDSTEEIVKEFG